MRPVVFTPRTAPAAKLDAIQRLGADLRAVAETYEESERLAKQHATETGAQYLSPYSHPDLLSAIGVIALEVIEDLPRVDRIVVPVGGGGLLAGIAIAAREVRPEVEVVGVEVEASHPFAASLAAGRIVEVQVGPTIADGLAGNMDPDNIAFPVVQALVGKMVVVGESAAARGGSRSGAARTPGRRGRRRGWRRSRGRRRDRLAVAGDGHHRVGREHQPGPAGADPAGTSLGTTGG